MKNLGFFLRADFSDGNLKERMIAEGLPAELSYRNATKRKVYYCSEGLVRALFHSGAQIEMIDWTPSLLTWRLTFGQNTTPGQTAGTRRAPLVQGHGEGRPV